MIRNFSITMLLFALTACSGKQDKPDSQMSDEEYTEAMATEHADEDPQPSGAEEQSGGELPTTSETVQYGTVGDTPLNGYLAKPEGETPKAAVIVIHEWWGLNDNIRTMTDKLASNGYLALAVDMYGKPAASTPEEAKKLMSDAMKNPEQGVANLKSAREFLAQKGATQFGVIGWCFGGGWALETGLTQGEAINAVVMYYGRVKTKPEEVDPLAAPLLGIFAAEDQGIPVDQVKQFEAALQATGANSQIHVYDGVDHAFANPSGERYSPEAAKDAWSKTLAFFEQHLR